MGGRVAGEGEKVRGSIPSLGMELRGPGSSGNAELADRSSQHSRKKEGVAAVAIATNGGVCGKNNLNREKEKRE